MTLIIAEAGVNHNGDIGLAKELIDIASECGADIVKFQSETTNTQYLELNLSGENEVEMIELMNLIEENMAESNQLFGLKG